MTENSGLDQEVAFGNLNVHLEIPQGKEVAVPDSATDLDRWIVLSRTLDKLRSVSEIDELH